jgi:hypothetical protein
MWGLKYDSTNDISTSPLEEQVFGVIPLVPLFTVSFYSNNVFGTRYCTGTLGQDPVLAVGGAHHTLEQ